MPDVPTGTVTFLFTDIEGSTALLQHLGDQRYGEVLAAHHQLLRTAFQTCGGQEMDNQGDAFLIVFRHAQDAVKAAVAAQRTICAHAWPEGAPVRVRMGLHTGEPLLASTGYVGLDVHRAARIMAAGYGGQVLLSRATSQFIEHDLPEHVALRDLGEHRLKDLARPEHIFQLVIPDLQEEFPPLKTLDVISNNLPIQLTSFIGREREIEDVKSLLSRSRLVTLIGAGGAGKTRLALQAAADLIDLFPKGVWLVELAPISDPALILQAVASTFEVREVAGHSLLDMLRDYLQPKSLLLVLDNCEHVVAAAAHLASDLLRACPNLKILATSREVLGIAGETTYRVPSLSRPDPRRLQSLEELTQCESVQLFVERGIHSQPRFALTDANAKAVAHICDQLDGIPLAIELAAARVKVLTADQIAARLDDRFRLLTGGSRTNLPRHQTLRAAMDWSHDLLSQEERTLLRRLSVFAGGFTLEAVEAVCIGAGLEVTRVLDLVVNLVDKSLVMAEGLNGETRYHLLETIRQYSLERLQEAGEVAAVHGRHLDWYLGLAEQAEPELQGPDQFGWLERLEMEHDNLRAALEWARSQEGGAEAGLRLAGALHRFWAMRGYLSEGRERLESLLASGNGPSSLVLAKALYGAGVLAVHQGDYARATVLCERSLSVYQELHDTLGIALSLNVLGFVARNQSDVARAEKLLRESLTLSRASDHSWALAEALIFLGHSARRTGDFHRALALGEDGLVLWRKLGDRRGIATALDLLGTVARYLRNYERARAYHEEGLGLQRELGSRLDLAVSLLNLGAVAMEQGNNARATQLLEEGLILCKELGYKHGVAASIGNLAIIARHEGNYERARTLLEESRLLWQALGDRRAVAAALRILGLVVQGQREYAAAAALHRESLRLNLELGDKVGIAESLAWLADLVRVQKNGALAARLLGAAEALRERVGTKLPPADQLEYEQLVAAIREALGAHAFDTAWTKGRTMPVEEAIDAALEFCETLGMKDIRS